MFPKVAFAFVVVLIVNCFAVAEPASTLAIHRHGTRHYRAPRRALAALTDTRPTGMEAA